MIKYCFFNHKIDQDIYVNLSTESGTDLRDHFQLIIFNLKQNDSKKKTTSNPNIHMPSIT